MISNKSEPYSLGYMDLLDPTISWIGSKGIDFKRTRFGQSEKILRKFVETLEVPSHEELWTVNDLLCLIEVYKSLGSLETEQLFLRKIMAGSSSLAEENKTEARDLFFEAKVKSRFLRSGFTLEEQPIYKSDIVVNFDSYTFYIECKRFKNIDRMIERSNEAFKQLSNVPDREKNGIICLDFSKIVYTDFIDCEYPVVNKKSLDAFKKEMDTFLVDLVKSKIVNIFNAVNSIFIYYSFPFIFEGSGVGKMEHYIFCHRGSNEESNFVYSKLGDAVGKF